MYTKTKFPSRLFTLIIISVMAVFILLASRQEQAASQSRQKIEQERLKADIEKVGRSKAALPRADYAAPEPKDPALRQLRKARGKQYKRGTSLENLREDVTEISIGSHDLLDVPGLPVEQSDLVVVGTITDAKGYVTENKSAAYSEYSVNITEVIKGAANLTGRQVTAERIGAKVVLPGGRTILVLDAYRGTPEANHRYVLFLKYSPEGEDYLVIMAYDLRNGRVMSIDRLAQCAFFDGNEETAFLDLVRSSIK
jgi:hypothetical protein